jgi:hypothetical protein
MLHMLDHGSTYKVDNPVNVPSSVGIVPVKEFSESTLQESVRMAGSARLHMALV